MLGFLLILASIVATGTALARRLSRRLHQTADPIDHPLETLFAGVLVGTALWLAGNWVLSLTFTLSRQSLLLLAAAFVISGIALNIEVIRGFRLPDVGGRSLFMLALVPLFGWVVLMLWRGSILPPLSHDALAYHLPRAVMILRAQGVMHFGAPDGRIDGYPANYELLLSNVLLLGGSDRLSEWISTAAFAVFLLAVTVFVVRWWGRGGWPLIGALFAAAATPVLLLHTGAHKNDVLMNVFALGALLWGSRWVARGGRWPMLLMLLCLAMGIGTKPNVAAIAIGLAPFLAWRAIREWRNGRILGRDLLAVAAVSAIAFLLCGGATYLLDALRTGVVVPVDVGQYRPDSGSIIKYGDWDNLWRFPFLLLTVPFSPNALGAWVPWRGEYWYWPRYELYFSHFGVLFTLLVIALPACIVRYRRQASAAAQELNVASIAALIALTISLPMQMRPVGFFATFPRYFLFIVPIVIAWTIPPLLAEVRSRSRLVAPVAAIALILLFCQHAVEYLRFDRFAPLGFVKLAAKHRGTRVIPIMPNRAGSAVDLLAGPNDTIAVDGSFDTWVYPAYGRELTRKVVFVPGNATPDDVPPEARWVMIDRSWGAIWGHPELTDMGRTTGRLGAGEPGRGDVRLKTLLQKDPRFRLVYERWPNQSVFERIPAISSHEE